MFRIRKVPNARAPSNRTAIAEAQTILRAQFPGMTPADIDTLPARLEDPFTHRFVAELFVAEDARSHVRGASVMLYDPELAFAFLDMLASEPGAKPGRGAGGALYERVRLEAASLGAEGLYFECLPDDPECSSDPAIRQQSIARLRFYERFGARPIVGTAYETPLSPEDADMPHLVFDGLGQYDLPDATKLQDIVRAILERKYGALCPPQYVAEVVDSIKNGQFTLRAPRYKNAKSVEAPENLRQPIPLVINDRHDIHHIRERGYVESPMRIASILDDLDATGLFVRHETRHFPDSFVREVHDARLITYLKSACAEAPEKTSIYPYVFPVRNATRPPKEHSVLAGYWCIDTFTPINRNAWPAARRAVDCTLTAAEAVLGGAPAAYALVRPPGHHAERKTFGGFCYLCNGAIAANYLARYGKVAILDIDYHHGNGQQDIFYERADVLTVSIHGDPSIAYPYFTGFRDETGRGAGAGYNLNLPLPETVLPAEYLAALDQALARIAEFGPDYLVLSLGFDTGRGDPTGTWSNRPDDFRKIGQRIALQGYPMVVVQEGGYRIRSLGASARAFFEGLAKGLGSDRHLNRKPLRVTDIPTPRRWRTVVRPEDAERIRALVAATDRFSTEEIAIAEGLAQFSITSGRESGYHFLLAARNDHLEGFACYGPIPGSDTSWDLYWIAVQPQSQGHGLGAEILQRVEAAIGRAGGRQVFIDTSSSPAYATTRAFYLRNGYHLAAELPDFYRTGDGKVIYAKGMTP